LANTETQIKIEIKLFDGAYLISYSIYKLKTTSKCHHCVKQMEYAFCKNIYML